MVKAVPRLHSDLLVLGDFFIPKEPPLRFIRGKQIFVARYGFGDASKSGFGSTFETENGISYCYGTWNTDGESQTSNFRELENLAQSLEREVSSELMKGAEVFIFTDNSTAEGAFFKGTSSSKTLFEIVLRLRKLEFQSKIKIYFIHVAGTRMISQGTDGLSRGDLREGVMRGAGMLSFVPLHLSAVERSESLKSWVTSWMSPSLSKNESIEFLNEVD